MLEKVRWVNDREANGAGVRRAQSVGMAPYGQERLMALGRKQTAVLPDGTPVDAGVAVLAVPVCEWVREPALEWGSDNLESADAGQSVP